jgi:hypothetical protein
MAKLKATVSKERQVNTYAVMRHASRVILENAEKDPEGSFYQVMASLIFTAFMMEAYLNHIGQRIFKCWNDLERLSHKSKLNLIAEKLGLVTNYGKRPYQTLSELFKFRDSIAHGKSVSLKSVNQTRIVDDTFDKYMREFLETQWEKYCTSENAKRALEDMETIIREVHKAAGMTDFPFNFGMQSSLSTLRPEEQIPNDSI